MENEQLESRQTKIAESTSQAIDIVFKKKLNVGCVDRGSRKMPMGMRQIVLPYMVYPTQEKLPFKPRWIDKFDSV